MTSKQKDLSELFQLCEIAGGSTKVLYLDDERYSLESFKARYRCNYEIYTASNQEEALSVLKSKKIDYFLSDYKMPKTNGIEVINVVKNLYPAIKSLLITACSEGIKTTIPILNKPFDNKEIFSYIY